MSGEIPDRDSIDRLGEDASREVAEASDLGSLEQARIVWLGRKGKLTSALRSIGKLPADQRPVVGGVINEWKERLDALFESRRAELAGSGVDSEPYPGDFTLPGRRGWEGGLHVLHRVIRDIKAIFYRMGYSIAEGPDVELDYYNFEALNFPADHPSRDLQDTFYVNRDILLRTQTSPVQVRFMEKHEPPLRIISPGRVL
jgi:phenylalanyl-tRNA synthetase alpha chain